jgi:hypothetical protein
MEPLWNEEWTCLICGIHRKMAMPAGYFSQFCAYCQPYAEQYVRESGKPAHLLDNDDFVVIAKMRLAAFCGRA